VGTGGMGSRARQGPSVPKTWPSVEPDGPIPPAGMGLGVSADPCPRAWPEPGELLSHLSGACVVRTLPCTMFGVLI